MKATPASLAFGRSAAQDSRQLSIAVFILVSTFCVVALSAAATDLAPGYSMTPTIARYYVLRDAFVRAAPDNNAERIGGVAKGARISALGKVVVPKTKDVHWIMVRMRDGRTGFVFGASLLPAIDGRLKAPLQGMLAAPERPDCGYVVSFTGKSQVADDVQQTADYDVEFDCVWNGVPLTFSAGMFITELPFQDRRDVFQINIDLWDMRVSDEEVLSVTALYDPMAKRVVFESVNDEMLGDAGNAPTRDAENVPNALSAALVIAHSVWRKRAWEILATLPKPDVGDRLEGTTP